MPYGRPKDSQRPIRTLTLDLPREVGSVGDVDSDRPPLIVIGPLDGETSHTEYDQIKPVESEIDAGLVHFHFEEPFSKGDYKAVVAETRIWDTNGDPFDLTDEDGNTWNSWRFQVYHTTDQMGPEPGEPIGFESDSADPVSVCIDGEPVASGTPEASGEVISLASTTPGDIRIEVESLWEQPRPTLYEKHLRKVVTERTDKPDVVSFVSAGPIDNHRWVHFGDAPTHGQLPLASDGNLAIGSAVVRPPTDSTKAPLIDRQPTSTSNPADHPNTYYTTYYEVDPSVVDVELEKYETSLLVAPKDISDDHNTPGTNPRLFPDGIWRSETLPSASDPAAVFDLPLGCRIKVMDGTEELWHVQSRLVPLLTTTETLSAEIGAQASTPAAKARLFRDVWRASKEALGLWGGPFPTRHDGSGQVTETMREFVLTRIQAGNLREDKAQGEVYSVLGENQFRGASDRGLERRISQLAQRLRDGEKEASLFSEDHVPGGSAGTASGLAHGNKYSPRKRARDPSYQIAPYTVSEIIRADSTTRFQYF